MPNYTWHNLDTDEYLEVHVPIKDRDIPPDEGNWERVIEMPAFTRRTYLDGQRKDLNDFKAIAKLGQAASELPKDDPTRNEIQKEITQRRKI